MLGTYLAIHNGMRHTTKARDLHIIRRAAMHVVFTHCPLCGNVNDGNDFTLYSRKHSLPLTVTGERAETHYCHIDAYSRGGIWSEDNLFVGHSYCNKAQGDTDLDWYCDENDTLMTANEIRDKAIQAKTMADEMIQGTMFYPKIAKVAVEMIRSGKPHRTGKDWLEKLEKVA